ncbi:hypothetical protein Tco_1162353 [Tanacetum coccineum]
MYNVIASIIGRMLGKTDRGENEDAVMADAISQQAVSMTYFDLLGHTFVVSYEKSQVSILEVYRSFMTPDNGTITMKLATKWRELYEDIDHGRDVKKTLYLYLNTSVENGKPRTRKLCIIEGSKPLKLLKPYSKLMELQLLMGLQPAAALSY